MNKFGYLLLGIMLSMHTNAQTNGGGNGGGAMVCRDKDRNITKIEMYDLYEGREYHKFTGPGIAGQTADEYFQNALNVTKAKSPILAAKIGAAYILLSKNIERIDKRLGKTIDLTFTFFDDGCDYEQVAIWDDVKKKVFMNSKLVDALEAKDPKGLAALWFHESSYYVDRMVNKASKSDFIREFNAGVFIKGNADKPIANISPYSNISDETTTHMTYFPDGHGFKANEGHALTFNWSKPECYRFTMDYLDESSDAVVLTVTHTNGVLEFRFGKKGERGYPQEAILEAGASFSSTGVTTFWPKSLSNGRKNNRGASISSGIKYSFNNRACNETLELDAGIQSYNSSSATIVERAYYNKYSK